MRRFQQSVPWLLACGCCLVGLTGSPPPSSAEPAQPKSTPTSKFMRAKLISTQQVLEGLAIDDFRLIEKGAEQMRLMSRATEWDLVTGPEYQQHSAEFRRCCDDLIKRAKQKNSDACALAHLQLTLACINCHRFVRSTRIAGREMPAHGQYVSQLPVAAP